MDTILYVIIDKTDDKPKLRFGVFNDYKKALEFAQKLTHDADGWNEYTVRKTYLNE